MGSTKVYIDGQSGTTGLQIYDRIGARDDLELLRIDDDKRHDADYDEFGKTDVKHESRSNAARKPREKEKPDNHQ